jgi:hypothetical protein
MLELVMLLLIAGPSGTNAEEDLFDGAPDPSAKLGAGTSHGRVTLQAPPGWRQPFILSGATWLASPDDAAVVLVYTADTDKVAFDAYLGAPLGTSTVKWSPAVSSKIGREHLPARVQPGSGRIAATWTEYTHSGGGTPWVLSHADKVDQDEARLWRVVLAQADRGRSYVVLTALKKAAIEQRRAELVACVRSLVWK